jgi:hypothetical protein
MLISVYGMELEYKEHWKPVHLLTEEERLQEIAKILAIGAIRYLRAEDRKRAEAKKPIQARVEVWDLVDDDIEKQVLRYLAVNVMAPPRNMERDLNIPHVTLGRRLSRLRAAGLIQVSGRTKGAQYCLAAHPGTN